MESRMRLALSLARRAWGRTHPNPLVGAIVYAPDGSLVGEGFHERAGGPHAEVHALRAAGERARGGTLYVTLEPCSTHGRTPPCTEAIIGAGIRRVVIGATDPNPAHAGRGLDILRSAGLEVIGGVLADECGDINLIFNHWIRVQRPLFAAKVATTIDGRIATRGGDSKWISGPSSRKDVHHWRAYFPAIAVGAGTVLADNPRLSIRLPGMDESCSQRFIFDRSLRTLSEPLPKVYSDDFRHYTTLVTSDTAHSRAEEALVGTGVRVLGLPDTEAFWPAFATHCSAKGINGVYFEGGGTLLSSLLRSGMLDYLFSYRAPVLLADDKARSAFSGQCVPRMADAIRLRDVRNTVFGEDVLTRGWLFHDHISCQ